MEAFLSNVMPNVADKSTEFWQAVVDTLLMTAWSGVFIFIIGLILGITLTLTKPGGIAPNAPVYQVVDKVVNLFRSIPFIILLAGVMPLSRLIMGTAIGMEGAIVPLVLGCSPFYSRQVESALATVDQGKIEAAQSMGLSTPGIVLRVYLKESIPALARGTTITIISLFGLVAMAGAVGGGGLGDFAIRYGHDRGQTDVTIAAIVAMVIIVTAVQLLGNAIARKSTH